MAVQDALAAFIAFLPTLDVIDTCVDSGAWLCSFNLMSDSLNNADRGTVQFSYFALQS